MDTSLLPFAFICIAFLSDKSTWHDAGVSDDDQRNVGTGAFADSETCHDYIIYNFDGIHAAGAVPV